MRNKIVNFFNRFVIYIAIGFFAILSLATFLITTSFADYSQSSTAIKFAPHIIIGIIAFIFLLGNKTIFGKLSKIDAKKLAKFAFFWGLIVSFAWVLIADVLPLWDSLDLVYATKYLRQDYSPFSISKWLGGGSYMQRFPFQTPIVMLLYLAMSLTGSNYILFFELLNCIACAFTMYYIVKLTDALFKNKTATSIAAILVMLFAPIVLYCTFIYGNVICLPFAVAAFYFQKLAIDSVKDRKKFIKYIIISSLCVILATFFKSTMIFAAIALAMVWLIWGLSQKKISVAIIGILVVILAKLSVAPLNAFLQSENPNFDLSHGVPMITWIAMGIGAGREYNADETGEESLRTDVNNAGYYDGLVWISPDGVYNPEAISATAKEYIAKRINHYKEDPGLLFAFFGNKLAIEWTEPTFEGLLASNWCAEGSVDGYSMCERQYTRFAGTFYYGIGNKVLIFWLDVLQTLLPLGALVALFMLRKKLNISQLVTIICVLGIAAVYLFWENKSQYMFPAFLLMIPFAGLGWSFILQRFSQSRIAAVLCFPRKSSPRTHQPAQGKSSATRRGSKRNK